MLKVVLDPNVLISARLSPRGAPGRLLMAWLDGRFELVVSPALLDELAGVLARPKFHRWLTPEEAGLFVSELRAVASVHEDRGFPLRRSRDPADDYLLALAQAASVDYLVSGDGDLTDLDHASLQILTPRAFLELLHKAGPESRLTAG